MNDTDKSTEAERAAAERAAAAHKARKAAERKAMLKGVGTKHPAPGNAGQPPLEK